MPLAAFFGGGEALSMALVLAVTLVVVWRAFGPRHGRRSRSWTVFLLVWASFLLSTACSTTRRTAPGSAHGHLPGHQLRHLRLRGGVVWASTPWLPGSRPRSPGRVCRLRGRRRGGGRAVPSSRWRCRGGSAAGRGDRGSLHGGTSPSHDQARDRDQGHGDPAAGPRRCDGPDRRSVRGDHRLRHLRTVQRPGLTPRRAHCGPGPVTARDRSLIRLKGSHDINNRSPPRRPAVGLRHRPGGRPPGPPRRLRATTTPPAASEPVPTSVRVDLRRPHPRRREGTDSATGSHAVGTGAWAVGSCASGSTRPRRRRPRGRGRATRRRTSCRARAHRVHRGARRAAVGTSTRSGWWRRWTAGRPHRTLPPPPRKHRTQGTPWRGDVRRDRLVAELRSGEDVSPELLRHAASPAWPRASGATRSSRWTPSWTARWSRARGARQALTGVSDTVPDDLRHSSDSPVISRIIAAVLATPWIHNRSGAHHTRRHSRHPRPRSTRTAPPAASASTSPAQRRNSSSARKTHRSFASPWPWRSWSGHPHVVPAIYAPASCPPRWGNMNLGLVLGLLQFVTTFGTTVQTSRSPTAPSTRRPRRCAASPGILEKRTETDQEVGDRRSRHVPARGAPRAGELATVGNPCDGSIFLASVR
ncbi:hypothetical protein QJS66_06830 [Kocuria rhizophila]|nr:hypothetical protein QJS66_06830 [Kocuria rhizophila]